MDGSESCVVFIDLDGFITYLSTEASHVLGFNPDFFVSNRVSLNTLVHRDQVSLVYNHLADLLTQKTQSQVFSFKAITNFGSYISLQADTYLNDRDNPTNFVMILRMDGDHLLYEQEDFVCQLSDQGIFQVVSPQCLILLGWRPYELLGTPFLNYLDEHSREVFLNEFKTDILALNQGAELIIHYRHKEKGFQPFHVHLGTIKSPDGSIVICTFKQSSRKVDESNSTIIPLNDLMDDSVLDMEFKAEDLNRSSSSLSLRSTDSSPILQMANLDLSRRRFSGSDEHLELGHRASLKKKAPTGGKMKLGARKSLEGTADTDGSDKKKKGTGKSVYRPSKRTDLICEFCNATESPEWRRGPAGTNNRLCNACGIKYAKKEKQLKEQKGSPLDDSDRQKLYENLLNDHRRQRSSPIV